MVARYSPRKGSRTVPRRGRGRPSAYRPEHCEQIIASGARGESLSAFAGSVGVCRDTVNEWAKKHPEFAAAKKVAEACAATFWEGQLRRLAEEGRGNATAIIFALKNRVPSDWRDQVHQRVDGTQEQIVRIEIDERTARALSADQQEALRAVLRVIEQGTPALPAPAPEASADPSLYARTLTAGSPTRGSA